MKMWDPPSERSDASDAPVASTLRSEASDAGGDEPSAARLGLGRQWGPPIVPNVLALIGGLAESAASLPSEESDPMAVLDEKARDVFERMKLPKPVQSPRNRPGTVTRQVSSQRMSMKQADSPGKQEGSGRPSSYSPSPSPSRSSLPIARMGSSLVTPARTSSPSGSLTATASPVRTKMYREMLVDLTQSHPGLPVPTPRGSRLGDSTVSDSSLPTMASVALCGSMGHSSPRGSRASCQAALDTSLSPPSHATTPRVLHSAPSPGTEGRTGRSTPSGALSPRGSGAKCMRREGSLTSTDRPARRPDASFQATVSNRLYRRGMERMARREEMVRKEPKEPVEPHPTVPIPGISMNLGCEKSVRKGLGALRRREAGAKESLRVRGTATTLWHEPQENLARCPSPGPSNHSPTLRGA